MTLTPDGPVEVRTGEELKGILARYTPEQLRLQMFDFEPSDAGQQINPDGPNRHVIFTPEIEDVIAPHQLYNNRSQNLGGILLESPGMWELDPEEDISGQVTWRFAQLDGDQSAGRVGVVIADPKGPNTRILSGGSGVVWGGTEDTLDIVVDYTLTRQLSTNEVVLDMVVKIDGVQVFSVSDLRRPANRWSETLPLIPSFETAVSGMYAIGAEEYDPEDPEGPAEATYFILKGLALEESLQEFSITPGEPAEFSNSFHWDYGDSPLNLQQASWDIKITAPGGAEVTTLSGAGRIISASWDTSSLEAVGPFRLKPKGQDSPDGGTPIYGYEIIIRALAYSDGSGHFKWDTNGYSSTFDDVFYEVSSAVSPRELKITNIELEPDPPFQDEGDTVTLTAEIVTVGLDDVSEDDVEWWVELIGPDGETVGDPLATGNGFAVEAEWDGTVDGAVVEEPGSYSLRVKASACQGGINPKQADIRAQQTCPPIAQIDISLSPGVLEIFDSNGQLLATSQVGGADELVRKKTVFPYGRQNSGVSDTLHLKISGVTGSPSKIEVTLTGSESQASKRVDLVDPEGDGVYEADFTLSSELIKIGNLNAQAQAVQTTFSSSTLPNTFLNQAVFEGLMGGITGIPYPDPKAKLGQFDDDPSPRDAANTPKNISNFGFETVKFETSGILTELKVRHPANVFYFLQHGGHDGSLALDTPLIPGVDFTRDDIADVKTIIFTSCSGLVLHDYNNLWEGLHRPFATLAQRKLLGFGGPKWFSATGETDAYDSSFNPSEKRTILLGFNHIAPAKLV